MVDGKKTKAKTKAKYYPGFTLVFHSIRDPTSKMIKVLFPSVVLLIFLIATFMLSVDDLANRLACLSICLLTYVGILDTLRSEMPQINSITYGDAFVILYIIISCTPVFFMIGRMWSKDPKLSYSI